MAKKPTLDEMRLALSKGKTKHEHAHEKARLNAIKMLGLHEKNTAQDRAKAMGMNTDVYHGSKQDIQGGFSPGYDDELSFVTPHPEFANKWIGKGKFNERTGDQAKAERDVADALYKEIKYKNMDYESLDKLKGDEFDNEYDRRNALSKADLAKEFGTQGHPMGLHNTVYPLKIKAHKTFNPETDMHVMEEFFRNNGIPQSNIDLYKTGNYMMYETKPVVNYLKSKGYDSMRLRESTDDNYPTIAVFDPKHVRSRFAAFDPAREHENDLLAAKGGEVHMAEGGSDEDYRGSHQAPGPHFGAPMHDVSGNGMYPEDFYGPNGARYYANINDPIDREAHRQVLSVRGKPDAMVTIHRAIPTHVHEAAMKTEDPIKHMIRHGDWVAIHKGYAKIHGEGPLKGKYKIASMRVPAKHVWTNADSIHEWGYHPEENTVTKAKGGVTHAHHLEIEERPL